MAAARALPKATTSTLTFTSTTPSLSARSLFLSIHPVPRSMTARLSILKALSRHGAVEHFRNLKHHPTKPEAGCWHAILGSEEVAGRLLRTGELGVDVVEGRGGGVVWEGEDEDMGDMGGRGDMATTTTTTTYTIQIRPSYHAPEIAVKGSALYGNWTPVRSSPIAEALRQRAPGGIAREALCDWVRDSPRERRAWFSGEGDGGVPWRIARRAREGKEEGESIRGREGMRREGGGSWDE